MEIQLSQFRWHEKNNIRVTGFLRSGTDYITGERLCDYFSETGSPAIFEQKLRQSNGQFSVVILKELEIWAATDRLRNYPLFYSPEGIISDDCYYFAEKHAKRAISPAAEKAILSTGFVINDMTLLDGVSQVEAGQYIIIGKEGLRRFYTGKEDVVKADIALKSGELNDLLHKVFSDHLQALKDRFIAIPLSGGYDSRLIAAMCAEYHPHNIICFTYGTRNNPEAILASKSAAGLGLKWINIIYDYKLVKGFPEDDLFRKYYPFAANLASMFYMQDYFAVKYLRDHYIIPTDTVFMPGFSGDMLAGSHLTRGMNRIMGRKDIARLIFDRYFNLAGRDPEWRKVATDLIAGNLPENESYSWRVIEEWDRRERQAKFIVNSAKVFTYFGYDYILPLWDKLFVDFFATLPFDLKLDKKLYDYVLKDLIFSKYDLNFKNELTASHFQKSLQRIKENVKLFLPGRVKDLFVRPESPVLYDVITGLMKDEAGPGSFRAPRQSNYYNSIIVQWYLLKTREYLGSLP